MPRNEDSRATGGVRLPSRSRVGRTSALAVVTTLLLAIAGLNAASAQATATVHNTYSCHEVTFQFAGFPSGTPVHVVEQIKLDGVVIYKHPFDFVGPSAANTVKITVPPGHHEISSHAGYSFGSKEGEGDHHATGGITCVAEPEFSIEKLQRLAGEPTYTPEQLTAKSGATVEYEIVVTNTGNVPLTFSNFVDEQCEMVSGGPTGPVAPGKSATYKCQRMVNGPGHYSNTATDTGNPPAGEGEPITHSSNTVVVNVVPEPAFTIEKRQEIAGSGAGYTKEVLKGKVGWTVNYQVTVTNTGNTPLTFGGFSDAKCDEGTISGGPGATLAPGESAVYTCTHLITEADKSAHVVENAATDTGTPPEGEGSPATNTSNVVTVVFPSGRITIEPSCTSVTFKLRGFPNLPGNTVKEKIKANGTVIYFETFTFDGSMAENTVPITLAPGTYELRVHVGYTNSNGLTGEGDRRYNIVCGP